MPKFSANLGFLWTDRPLLDRIDAAATAGFKAVEMHWPYDVSSAEVRAACIRNDLALLAINTPVGDAGNGEFGLGAVPGRERAFQVGFDLALAYCWQTGAGAIHAMAGVVPDESRSVARQVFAANLRAACHKAAEAGLVVLLEPINRRDKPGYFYSTLSEAVALIDELALPNLKLMFDVYHVGVSEGDITRKLERYLPIIGHIQIAAVPSRAEPDEGEVAYAGLLNHIDEVGYTGWVGCEYKPRGNTNDGLKWMKEYL